MNVVLLIFVTASLNVALIELFAWMTDLLLYRLNQVPDLHYIRFMEMLGIRLREPVAAKTRITFWLSKPQEQSILIPGGTEVASTQTETERSIVFTTDGNLVIHPPQLSMVISVPAAENGSKPKSREINLRRLTAGFEGTEVFSTTPKINDALSRISPDQRAVAVKRHTDRGKLFARDRIFATLTLAPEELSLYDRVYELLGPRVVKPDLVVYLQARTDVLLSRVRKRGRDFERAIDGPWLEALAKAYNEHFFHYDDTPLLVVNASDIDLEGSADDVEALLAVIRKHRKGRQHYVPLGTRPY